MVQCRPMSSQLVELKQAAVVHSLRGCRLFAGLPADDLEKIAAITVTQPVAKDAYLFREGEPARGFYIVQQGAINVHRVNAAGKEQVIHIFRAGESFAEAALATDRGYPADARAVESSQVLMVQKAGMLTLIKRQPDFALRMLASMSGHLRVLVGQLEDLTLKDVETRMANWLLKRCPAPPGETPVKIKLNTTKRTLAAELGTVSETLSRTLARFRDQSLIRVQGTTITITSPLRLAKLLKKNPGTV
jgi:CRP/FNR family transcriptional regulator, dissimilatory nitrate respiration regulator